MGCFGFESIVCFGLYNSEPTKYDYCEETGFGGVKKCFRKIKSITPPIVPPIVPPVVPPVVKPPVVTTCDYPSTNFKNKTESNEFRKFMHDNFLDYSNSISLSLLGPMDNCKYIRKAYATVPDGYSLSYGEIFLKSKTNPNWKENFKKENYNDYKQKEDSDGKYKTQSGMWDDLIKKERVPKGGEIKKLKGGSAWYIIKIKPDGTIVTMTGTETTSINSLIAPLKSGEFMYVAWIPPSDINKQPITGEVADLKVKQNVNGEDYVGADKRPGTTWKAFDAGTTFEDDLKESIIKDILNLLTESDPPPDPPVNINSFMSSPSSSGSQTNVNLGNFMSSSTMTNNKSNINASQTITMGSSATPEEIKKVIDPIRLEALEILNGLKDFAKKLKKEDEINKAIELLTNFDPSKACEKENIDKIKEGKSQIDAIVNKNEFALSAFPIVKASLERLQYLLSDVVSKCEELNKKKSITIDNQLPGSQTKDEPNCINTITDLHKTQLSSISAFTESNPSYSLEFTSTGTQSSISLKDLKWSKKYGVGTEQGNLVVPQPPDYPQFKSLCSNLKIYKRSDIQGKTPDQVASLEAFFKDEKLKMTVDETKFGVSELRFKVGALVPLYKLEEKGLGNFENMPVYITDIDTVANPTTEKCRAAIKQLDACIGGSKGGGLKNCSDLKSIVTNKLTAYYCIREVRGEGKFWNRLGLGQEVANISSDRSGKFGISKMIAIKESTLEKTIKKTLTESIKEKNNTKINYIVKNNLKKYIR